MKEQFIPVYQPMLAGKEQQYVAECMETTWISSKGKYVSRFENDFSRYLGIGYSTAVSNGTAALHLALHTLGIGPGDEVLVPTLTYIASVNSIAYVGAKPVFIDSEPDTWNIDSALIEQKITPRTKAVMAVHLYGSVCAMEPLQLLCRKHNLLLIEDVAEAFGSQYRGRYAGSFGDIATFSFFGNKTLTTGEGGMVASNDQSIIKRAAYLKSQAVSEVREYWHDEIGFNFRMTNLCAAIGVAQLEYADDILQKKRDIASWYQADLEGTSIEFQADIEDTVNSYWMVSVLAKDENQRDLIRKNLKNNGIETRPLFHPAHTMPTFKTEESYPVAEQLSCRGLNLPSYPTLLRDQVAYISSKIIEVVNK